MALKEHRAPHQNPWENFKSTQPCPTMPIHWPQKEGCRKVFIGGSDAARFANCPLPSPPQTSPLSLPQPPCLRWPMCPSWGRVLISVTRMFTVRICLLTASPMLCSIRWICVFSGRTSCDFSGRASPILQHHQKKTSEDFSVCHL